MAGLGKSIMSIYELIIIMDMKYIEYDFPVLINK